MRGIAAMFLLALSGAGEERGKYRLSCYGREAGFEEYRLEKFEDGTVVLFAKVRSEVEVQGRAQTLSSDTVLTMDDAFAPKLYAAFHTSGADVRRFKIEWGRGTAAMEGRRPVRTSAAFLLDAGVHAHLLPILRRHAGGRRTFKVFSPPAGQDLEAELDERGETTLAGPGGRTLRVREIRLTMGPLTVTAYLDAERRMVRAWSPLTGVVAELEGFEGFVPEDLARGPRRPEGVQEEEVVFSNGPLRIAGAFARPKGTGPVPAVLILSDAGPHDRDGRAPGGPQAPGFPAAEADTTLYRAVAYALASAGVASLRFDDRGCGATAGGDFSTARLGDLLADAQAAAAYLRSRPDVAGMAVLGHGEGGLLASMLAARSDDFRAVFLLAAPGRTLDRLLLEVLERTLREQGAREEAAAAILAKEARVFDAIRCSEEDYLVLEERRTFVGWMRDRFRADPVEELARVRAPVVILQGLKDEQVPPAHAELLERARPEGIEARRFPHLGHAFTRFPGRTDEEFLRFLAERAGEAFGAR
jgi:pimeloyl-ACP methyl ester carboxylesterase